MSYLVDEWHAARHRNLLDVLFADILRRQISCMLAPFGRRKLVKKGLTVDYLHETSERVGMRHDQDSVPFLKLSFDTMIPERTR